MSALVLMGVSLQDLEELDEVACGCGSPATWLSTLRPCGHQFPLCDKHAEDGARVWAAGLADPHVEVDCQKCKTPVMSREARQI